MKRFCAFAVMAIAIILSGSSCRKEEAKIEYLEVNVNNIAGAWQASQWHGKPLVEGTFVYINFIRKDAAFELYQNLDSFAVHRLTGSFNIVVDERLGSVIMGKYDYDAGLWERDYVITELTSDSMVWTAVDDPSDVAVYTRVTSIPVSE